MAMRAFLFLLAAWFTCAEILRPEAGLAQTPPPRNASSPRNVIGRVHPGRIAQVSGEGITVLLQNGTTQAVQFDEIWRIRNAFVSDEPAGTSVIDFANNRLFVATSVPDLIGAAAKRLPLIKFTAPNGEAVYIVASKVTDISNPLPGLHNPLSKAVIGTRDGTQQVLETVESARHDVAEAHVTQ